MVRYGLMVASLLVLGPGCKDVPEAVPAPTEPVFSEKEESPKPDVQIEVSENSAVIAPDAVVVEEAESPQDTSGPEGIENPKVNEPGEGEAAPESETEEPVKAQEAMEAKEGEEGPEADDKPKTEKKDETSDLEKVVVGPDGPAEPKEGGQVGVAFPPKDSPAFKVPEGKDVGIVDPRVAPDSNADFDEDRVPLGRSTDQGDNGLSSIPRALVFYPLPDVAKGQTNSQSVRVSSNEATSLSRIEIGNPAGPFKLKKAVTLPLALEKGGAALMEVECSEGDTAHETTLIIEGKNGTIALPLRYFPTAP